ncbi:hypothetical protein J2X15_003141 [Rhodoferax saidenbachensis]|uniref:Uncharacterized protein n=1 Tax=Rhodoferax saidenbachensis TaxID=1484693 RepID=A0ABU1ZQN4_9BURK|nr:hypothetical protein [Rhodoferax saidenbachensis]
MPLPEHADILLGEQAPLDEVGLELGAPSAAQLTH